MEILGKMAVRTELKGFGRGCNAAYGARGAIRGWSASPDPAADEPVEQE